MDNKIIISEKDYKELLNYKELAKGLAKGELIYFKNSPVDCTGSFFTKDEALIEAKEINEHLSKLNDILKEEKESASKRNYNTIVKLKEEYSKTITEIRDLEQILGKVKKMSYWEFRKWKKSNEASKSCS